ncbi:hypothetical protein L6R49_15400 [Myxococcota bacterium]|nr:hypothetical protein [Myxococcota bacterium]
MLALLWFACGAADGPWRLEDAGLLGQESYELIGLNVDNSVLDVRVSRNNTGLLRGAGAISLDLDGRRELPLSYGRRGPPTMVTALPDDGGLVIGPDGLRRDALGWTLDARDVDLDLRLRLTPSPEGAPTPEVVSSTGRGRFGAEALVSAGTLRGVLRAGTRDLLVDGWAVLTRRRGDDPPALRGAARTALYVHTAGFSMGIDLTGGSALCWARLGEEALDARDCKLSEDGRLVSFDLRPSAPIGGLVQLWRQPDAQADLRHGLSDPERWLLDRVIGRPVRSLRAGAATVYGPGGSFAAQALTLTVRYE